MALYQVPNTSHYFARLFTLSWDNDSLIAISTDLEVLDHAWSIDASTNETTLEYSESDKDTPAF